MNMTNRFSSVLSILALLGCLGVIGCGGGGTQSVLDNASEDEIAQMRETIEKEQELMRKSAEAGMKNQSR